MREFNEVQQLNKWLLAAIYVFLLLLLCFQVGISIDLLLKSPHLVVITSLPVLLALALIYFTKLKTEIDDEGIHITFSPYMLKKRSYLWEDIASGEIRKYKPLKEYGGWGIKFGLKSGMSYTMRGNMGIQIVTKEGKKVLIGTQKSEEVAGILAKYLPLSKG